MAWNREATVFVLDVGAGMKDVVEGKMTALEVSTTCMTRMLHNKLFTESKDEFALILCGSEETENRLNSDVANERYDNIKTEQDLKLVSWEMLESMVNQDQPTAIQGDVFDAIRVALDIIEQDAAASKRKRFASRRIVVFSNLKSPTAFSTSQVDTLAKDLQQANVGVLQLIGRDLDAGPMEPAVRNDKTHGKQAKGFSDAAKMMNHLFEKLISLKIQDTKESYSYEDAVAYSTEFTTRVVRPTPWKALLELGETLKIPVVAYSEVKLAAPKQTWKKAIAQDVNNPIQQSVEYFIQKGLQREEIKPEDVIEGHKYGSTLVPFTADDKLSMKFTNIGKCLKVLGFASADEVKNHLYMGSDVKVMTAPEGDQAAQKALSGLVHALEKEKAVVIARFGYNAISAPKLVSLSPHIREDEKEHFEGLYFHYLPFADDLRMFTFPSLTDDDQKDNTKPNAEQLTTMDAYIDKLTLTEDNDEFEATSPKQINNPYLQRLYLALQFRALKPDEPVPPLDERLLDKLRMPDRLVKLSKAEVEQMTGLFPMKKVETKPRFKNGGVFQDEAHPGDDGNSSVVASDTKNDSKAAQDTVKNIGTIAPADDFRVMVSKADDGHFANVMKKAVAIINQLIFKTFEGSVYADKVILLLYAMREESVKRNLPGSFNDFLRSFKDDLLEKNFDDVWNKIVAKNLNLISKSELTSSTVSSHQATEFLQSRKEVPKEKKNIPVAAKEDDMFDEMFS
ncbi:X-ray repair cross-complementing protein 5-like [Paramacrobiotus metropolitanus]|uniref:X-ray repair cross-complementing protein 5-like n=1 Tax=Paramacrobiotus metropolitanus TaxID=2943436 RepID=UPI002445D3E9|nr:X-ray repair cross-complementing protein 5-like [Paramacrobiotus metropolitanus]